MRDAVPESAVEHIRNAQQFLITIAQTIENAPDVSGALKLELSSFIVLTNKRLLKSLVAIEQGRIKPEVPQHGKE